MGTSGKMLTNGSNGTHPRGGGGSGCGGGAGRSYGLMLMVAFGAAILGVMVLHKLREVRLFSLLVKEKDNELLSLHLLLQEEREINKESRKKLDELKSELQSLRAQKRETDTRVLEMESTLASLREEQKTVESTLEERRQEIQRLRSEAKAVDSHVSELQKSLRLKEEEIESLQRQIAYRDVWSVSSDNPSQYIPTDPTTAAAADDEKKPERVQQGRADGSRNVRVLGDGEGSFLSGRNQAGKEEDEVSQGNETDSGKKGADDHKVGGWKRRIIDENDSKNEQSMQRNRGGSAHHRFRRNNRWREVIKTRLRESGLSEADDAADVVSRGSRRFRRRRFEEILRARNRNNNDRNTEEDRTVEKKNEEQAQLNSYQQGEHLMRGNDDHGGNEEKIKEVTSEEIQKTNRVNVTEAEKDSDEKKQVDHTNPEEVKETLSVVEEAKKDDSSSNTEDQAMEQKNFDETTPKDSEVPGVSSSIMEGENSTMEKNDMEEKERGLTPKDGGSSELDDKDGRKGGVNEIEDDDTVEADTKLKENLPGTKGSDEMAKETEF